MIRALMPDEIHARRRLRVIALVYAWELAWAFLVAGPASTIVDNREVAELYLGGTLEKVEAGAS